jgi:hypothetical protein
LAGSPVNGKASWTNPRLANDPWFDKVTYAGPMGATDWTSPWANWDPQNTVYAVSVNEIPLEIDRVNVYPNPSRGNTSIDFMMASAGQVKIEILDITGRSIMSLQDGFRNEGQQHLTFDVSNLSSGACFIKISTKNSTSTKKLFIQH